MIILSSRKINNNKHSVFISAKRFIKDINQAGKITVVRYILMSFLIFGVPQIALLIKSKTYIAARCNLFFLSLAFIKSYTSLNFK